jgi:RNA ligase
MVNIYDIMGAKELVEMTKGGYVRVQTHPVYPYNIACYTKQAMFERVWNDVTMNCRGLIYHQETGEVLARPFKKFFNYGEPNAPEFAPDDWVTVYDKVDGSLGIAYDTPDGPAIATKGSFASDQAIHATEVLRTKYPRYFHDDIHTDLFEIIYPENRIVLDYGDADELRYLGSVNMEDGSDYWNGMLIRQWGIPVNHFMLSAQWDQALQILNSDYMNRSNAEGVVILNDHTGERLKLKQEDYIELHRVMTGLNERQIWQWMSEGKYLGDILPDLPEEMHEWARSVYNRICEQYLSHKGTVVIAFQESKYMDRKEFALFNSGKPNWVKGALFARYDGNLDREDEIVWKQVKP